MSGPTERLYQRRYGPHRQDEDLSVITHHPSSALTSWSPPSSARQGPSHLGDEGDLGEQGQGDATQHTSAASPRGRKPYRCKICIAKHWKCRRPRDDYLGGFCPGPPDLDMEQARLASTPDPPRRKPVRRISRPLPNKVAFTVARDQSSEIALPERDASDASLGGQHRILRTLLPSAEGISLEVTGMPSDQLAKPARRSLITDTLQRTPDAASSFGDSQLRTSGTAEELNIGISYAQMTAQAALSHRDASLAVHARQSVPDQASQERVDSSRHSGGSDETPTATTPLDVLAFAALSWSPTEADFAPPSVAALSDNKTDATTLAGVPNDRSDVEARHTAEVPSPRAHRDPWNPMSLGHILRDD